VWKEAKNRKKQQQQYRIPFLKAKMGDSGVSEN
jgi:hypothetical protein